MKSTQASTFPLKLVFSYFIIFALIPDIFHLRDYGTMDELAETWNEELLLSLILSIPLTLVVGLAVWSFRRMPYFASATIVVASIMVIDAIASYFIQGFDPRFPVNFELINVRGLSFVAGCLALPFLIAYTVWFIWPRKAPSRGLATRPR